MIDVRSVYKHFGVFTALDNVSLHVREGELVALLGPSGSGKTTLLRIIAGLDFPSAGHVLFEGQDATLVRARDRRVGFVFQHFALFRHMTVFENVAFGLKVRSRKDRPSRDEIGFRVHRLLEMVQLEGLAMRYPSQLSGGQRQRVALARALAIEPKVILLDEPFGALDAKVRRELRRWLRHLHDELGLTGVFVTHDQEEALEVADRVVVMNEGRIEQIGTPTEIYDHPASPFIYRFLGNVNSFDCVLEGEDVRIGGVPLHLSSPLQGRGTAFVRPHELDIGLFEGESREPVFLCVIRHAVILGAQVRIELESPDGQLYEAEIPRERFTELGVGKGTMVRLFPRRAHVFAQDGTRANTDEISSSS